MYRVTSNNPSTDVFASPSLIIGRYRCPPGHPLWNTENHMNRGNAVVFPRVSVAIRQQGRRSLVADANCVMFYNMGRPYTRRVLVERGDASEYFLLSPALTSALAAEFDPSVHDHPGAPFRFPNGQSDARCYMRQRKFIDRMTTGQMDSLAIQETALDILHHALSAAYSGQCRRAVVRKNETSRIHAEIAEAVKELLARRFREPLLLEDIASTVHVSIYHLCRLFRRHTGLSLHAYIDQMRLRAALEELADPSADLTGLALRLGYSSHSHFTQSFRRLYGVTPSALKNH